MRHVVLVLNPHSRRNRGRDRAGELREILGARGEVFVTRSTSEIAPTLERALDGAEPAATSPGARFTSSSAAITRPAASTAAAITVSIVRVLSPNAALQGAARSDASYVVRRQIESRPDVRSEGSSMEGGLWDRAAASVGG